MGLDFLREFVFVLSFCFRTNIYQKIYSSYGCKLIVFLDLKCILTWGIAAFMKLQDYTDHNYVSYNEKCAMMTKF